ncbi:MAG: hypothetical protein JKY18_08960 [Flavobacteriales bacterium]|nr:hypothetical protein [Flavobacteriales bacterium]
MGKVCLFLAGLVIAPILSYSQTTYYSRATGNWDVAATWSTVSCNGAVATSFPGASDHVVICATHTVLNTGAGAIVDLTVNANSTFDMDGSNFVVTGDVLINGQVINGGRLRLDGVNTDIDGLGSTDASTRIEFRIGDKNVLSTANLTFARDVQVQSGVTVTNYGTVTTNKNLNDRMPPPFGSMNPIQD